MSIHDLQNKHGLRGITMRYEDGGAVQVFTLNGREVRFGPSAGDEEIKAAFEKDSSDGR